MNSRILFVLRCCLLYSVSLFGHQACRITCPTDRNITLPANADQLNITVPQPDVSGCDQGYRNLSCSSCPSTLMLDEGDHEISFYYKYQNTISNINHQYTRRCSYYIRVTKLSCINQTTNIYLNTGQALSRRITFGDQTIALPAGISEIGLSQNCFHTYQVHEWSNIERRAELQAKYPINCNCSTISTSSFAVIDGTLAVHTRYMKIYCIECKITQILPDIQCLGDNLIVTWKTNFTGSQTDQTSDMKNELLRAVEKLQSSYQHLDITVFSSVPMVYSPVEDENGLNMKVLIRSSCPDEGYIYRQETDRCEKPPGEC